MSDNWFKLVSAIVDLIKALAWPALVVWLLLRFRVQVGELLTRLGSFKVAGGEFVFQQASVKVTTDVQAKRMIELHVGPDGFLTSQSLREVVSDFGSLDKDEPVKGELLIFQTPRQRTWLIATAKRTFVVLDDEQTRRKRNLVQKSFDLKETLPLEFGVESGSGIVNFAADETSWFFIVNTCSLLPAT
jgi:hypothetical protein